MPSLAASLSPDPGSDVGRVCALESLNYMKNQLLRDADWAGMAHGVEIRAPLVDIEVSRALACCLPRLRPGAGKAALAAAPSISLPAAVVSRAKTGFAVPTGVWTAAAGASDPRQPKTKGIVSRRWAQRIFAEQATHAAPVSGLATAA